MLDACRNNPFIVTGGKRSAYTHRAEVSVRMGQAREGKQPLRIEWVVKDPQGKRLKFTVVQKNDIPEGSLDGPWGRVADDAARAGVSHLIQELLLQPKR